MLSCGPITIRLGKVFRQSGPDLVDSGLGDRQKKALMSGEVKLPWGCETRAGEW